MSALEPVGSDDILYRLRQEAKERESALKLGPGNSLELGRDAIGDRT